jgi:hypothetical protein
MIDGCPILSRYQKPTLTVRVGMLGVVRTIVGTPTGGRRWPRCAIIYLSWFANRKRLGGATERSGCDVFLEDDTALS